MDKVDKATRSRIMASIQSRSNRSTEWRLRALLVQASIKGWHVQPHGIYGNPDFAFPREEVVLFVDGCFWHGCPLHCRIPTTNQDYWRDKFMRNRKRDSLVTKALQKDGWIVLRFWEHEVNSSPSAVIKIIKDTLGSVCCEFKYLYH